MDDFSALVIYTALLALHVKPELWDKYAKYQAGKLINDNLLFKSEDFQATNNSAIFQDLYKLGDPKVKAALDELKKACTMPVDAVRLPTTLIDPEYEKKKALATLEEAIKRDDDEEIVKAWTPKLEKYNPAQPHRPRVELAQKRNTALKKFRAALRTDDDERIAFDYDKILDGYAKITPAERQRRDLALRRVFALTQVKKALASGNEEKIAAAYDPILDNYPKLTPPERQKIAEARQCAEMRDGVLQAIATDDDDQIIAAYNPKFVRPWMNFTPVEQQRIELAQKRTEALKVFRAALKTDDDEKIVLAYDPALDGYAKITPEERKRYRLAKKRVMTLHTNSQTSATRKENSRSSMPRKQTSAQTKRKSKSKSLSHPAKSSRALRVFLCHSSGDKVTVRRLYNRLNKEGIDVWLDEQKLLPGQDWNREITKAVRSSDVVLVCLSRGSVNKTGYVQKEIKYALDIADEQPDEQPEDTIFVIPLKLEECEVPERLRRWQWLNFFERNGYEQLVRALQHRASTIGIALKRNTK